MKRLMFGFVLVLGGCVSDNAEDVGLLEDGDSDVDGDDGDEDGEMGAPEVRTPLWDGTSEDTIQLELNGFSGDGYNYTLDLGAMTIGGDRFDTGDALSCSVLYTLETTAIAEPEALAAALLATALLTRSEADCAAAKEDGTTYSGDFPQIIDSDGMRWSTAPASCRIALIGDSELLSLVEDAYFAAEPTAEETSCP